MAHDYGRFKKHLDIALKKPFDLAGLRTDTAHGEAARGLLFQRIRQSFRIKYMLASAAFSMTRACTISEHEQINSPHSFFMYYIRARTNQFTTLMLHLEMQAWVQCAPAACQNLDAEKKTNPSIDLLCSCPSRLKLL